MHVSVIIPAHNAADTIADTLRSLLDQTFQQWEAIIVDDGSTDETTAVVTSFVQRDGRFRLLQQKQKGVSAARNHGLARARFDWLLFLDADDWILPRHLEQLTGVLEADPTLDAAYCGWAYVTPDGEHIFGDFGGPVGDLFVQHAQYCFSVIHTYVVRRALVETVGGFDLSMRTCEDWDLWQRVARSGARFGAVRDKLAAYRIRAGSATSNGQQLFVDGLRVLTQGHASDPRVPKAHPLYPEGLPKVQLTEHQFGLLCACAGYLIGTGTRAGALFELFKDKHFVKLRPDEVAEGIFVHALVAAARPRGEWDKLWARLKEPLQDFLMALEAYSGTPRLASRTQRYLSYLQMKYGSGTGAGYRLRSVKARVMLGVYRQSRKMMVRVYIFKHCLSGKK